MGIGELLGLTGVATVEGANLYAFIMLNALVNQCRWHILQIRHSLGEIRNVDYKPIKWTFTKSLKEVFTYTKPSIDIDPLLSKMDKAIQRFPKDGISSFTATLFGTLFEYKQAGGDLLRDALTGVAAASSLTFLRAFQLLNRVYNEYRWYLLEYRKLTKDKEVANVKQTYVSTSATRPLGKLLRGKSALSPIADPNLKGLEKDPPLQHFIDEIWSGQTGGGRRRTSQRTRQRTRRRRSGQRTSQRRSSQRTRSNRT